MRKINNKKENKTYFQVAQLEQIKQKLGTKKKKKNKSRRKKEKINRRIAKLPSFEKLVSCEEVKNGNMKKK